jgi:hypothetical protein
MLWLVNGFMLIARRNSVAVTPIQRIYDHTHTHLDLNLPPLESKISALPLSYWLFAWKVWPVLAISKERKGFTEHLRNCPEYSGDFLNVKEIPPLNFLRRIL